MICDCWDVVVVPFPFTDSARSKRRPALVISRRDFNNRNHHSMLAMITTAKRAQWRNDVEIGDLEQAGLPRNSVVRMKIFTLDNRLILKRAGNLSLPDRIRVVQDLKLILFDSGNLGL